MIRASLDTYYSQFVSLKRGGQWFTHGNSGLFACSTDIKAMQMDNLSYNPSENILIANELKLGGKKNPDQILKYALMYRLLLERGFISPDTRFMLLFIGDKLEPSEWDDIIKTEIKEILAQHHFEHYTIETDLDNENCEFENEL